MPPLKSLSQELAWATEQDTISKKEQIPVGVI